MPEIRDGLPHEGCRVFDHRDLEIGELALHIGESVVDPRCGPQEVCTRLGEDEQSHRRRTIEATPTVAIRSALLDAPDVAHQDGLRRRATDTHAFDVGGGTQLRFQVQGVSHPAPAQDAARRGRIRSPQCSRDLFDADAGGAQSLRIQDDANFALRHAFQLHTRDAVQLFETRAQDRLGPITGSHQVAGGERQHHHRPIVVRSAENERPADAVGQHPAQRIQLLARTERRDLGIRTGIQTQNQRHAARHDARPHAAHTADAGERILRGTRDGLFDFRHAGIGIGNPDRERFVLHVGQERDFHARQGHRTQEHGREQQHRRRDRTANRERRDAHGGVLANVTRTGAPCAKRQVPVHQHDVAGRDAGGDLDRVLALETGFDVRPFGATVARHEDEQAPAALQHRGARHAQARLESFGGEVGFGVHAGTDATVAIVEFHVSDAGTALGREFRAECGHGTGEGFIGERGESEVRRRSRPQCAETAFQHFDRNPNAIAVDKCHERALGLRALTGLARDIHDITGEGRDEDCALEIEPRPRHALLGFGHASAISGPGTLVIGNRAIGEQQCGQIHLRRTEPRFGFAQRDLERPPVEDDERVTGSDMLTFAHSNRRDALTDATPERRPPHRLGPPRTTHREHERRRLDAHSRDRKRRQSRCAGAAAITTRRFVLRPTRATRVAHVGRAARVATVALPGSVLVAITRTRARDRTRRADDRPPQRRQEGSRRRDGQDRRDQNRPFANSWSHRDSTRQVACHRPDRRKSL